MGIMRGTCADTCRTTVKWNTSDRYEVEVYKMTSDFVELKESELVVDDGASPTRYDMAPECWVVGWHSATQADGHVNTCGVPCHLQTSQRDPGDHRL